MTACSGPTPEVVPFAATRSAGGSPGTSRGPRWPSSAGAEGPPRPPEPTRSATSSTSKRDCPTSPAPPGTTSSRSTTSRCASAESPRPAPRRWPRHGSPTTAEKNLSPTTRCWSLRRESPSRSCHRYGRTASPIGTVSPEVAATLGIGAHAVVVAGTPDLHSAWAGSGAVKEREAHIAISTTSWVSCPFRRKKTDPFRQIATVPGVLPGLRLVANNQETGGRALEWLRGRLAEAGVAPSFEELDHLAARRRTRQRSRRVHSLARRGALPRRRPQGAGGVPQPLAPDHARRPGPLGARGGGAQLALAARGRRAIRRAALSLRAGARRGRDVSRSGVRSTPTSSASRSSKSPTPATPTCAAAPSSPASRSGTCKSRSFPCWFRSRRSTSPTPPPPRSTTSCSRNSLPSTRRRSEVFSRRAGRRGLSAS